MHNWIFSSPKLHAALRSNVLQYYCLLLLLVDMDMDLVVVANLQCVHFNTTLLEFLKRTILASLYYIRLFSSSLVFTEIRFLPTSSMHLGVGEKVNTFGDPVFPNTYNTLTGASSSLFESGKRSAQVLCCCK